MSEERLNELRGHVNRLKSLLDDPQPGLSTWVEFYGDNMEAISKFWTASQGVNQEGQRIKVEMVVCPYDRSKYRIVKIVHASNLPLVGGKCLRVGDQFNNHDDLADKLALKYDVVVSESRTEL